MNKCFNAPRIGSASDFIRYSRRVGADGMTAFIATEIDSSATAIPCMLIRHLSAATPKDIPPPRIVFKRPIKLKTTQTGNNVLRATR